MMLTLKPRRETMQNIKFMFQMSKKLLFCKIDFTKKRFFVFFILRIMIISKKYIIFAPRFKKRTKLQNKF